jgi:hypothetical protein
MHQTVLVEMKLNQPYRSSFSLHCQRKGSCIITVGLRATSCCLQSSKRRSSISMRKKRTTWKDCSDI